MIFTVPLQPGTLLANVRYKWIAAGVAGSVLSSGITQPDGAFPVFRIDAAPPAGAEEVLVYDNSDAANNWNTGGYKMNVAAALGDPWAIALPGAYPLGQAGYIIGRLANIDTDAVQVVSPVSVDGGKIIVRAGDSWTIPITGLGNISAHTKLWFSVNKFGQADTAANLFIEKTAGLTRVNGATYATTGHGSLTVNDATAGNITIAVDEAVTKLLSGSVPWTMKMLDGSGNTRTLATGSFVVTKYGIEATQ